MVMMLLLAVRRSEVQTGKYLLLFLLDKEILSKKILLYL
jgi:hypothetical protein